MREQDDLLIDIIRRELRESKGRGDLVNLRPLREAVEVIGPAISLDAIADAVDVQLIERLGDYWDEMFGRLVAYKQQHGDCMVPRYYSDKKLGKWVNTQRSRKNQGKLEAVRVQRLEELGFVWNSHDEAWEEMFGRLVTYKEQHSDCLVPKSYSDKKLINWVLTQRMVKNQGRLEAARIQRLEEMGFLWNLYDEAWEEMFGRLVVYKQQHGDCLVPKSYSDKKLINWVLTQRMVKNQGRLEAARIQRLEEMGFLWNLYDEAWEEMFGRLVVYKQQHGDCRYQKATATRN